MIYDCLEKEESRQIDKNLLNYKIISWKLRLYLAVFGVNIELEQNA